MKMMKKNDNMTKGQKAEMKRLTAQGMSEAKARLKVIAGMKKANPGIGLVIPKKQERQLKKFVNKNTKKK
jgi:indole-3-glycerol phosphate synthase